MKKVTLLLAITFVFGSHIFDAFALCERVQEATSLPSVLCKEVGEYVRRPKGVQFAVLLT